VPDEPSSINNLFFPGSRKANVRELRTAAYGFNLLAANWIDGKVEEKLGDRTRTCNGTNETTPVWEIQILNVEMVKMAKMAKVKGKG